MNIKIEYINPPKEGRKTGSIKTETGQYLDVWPDKLEKLEVGGRYKIDVKERQFNGKTYYTATNFRRLGSTEVAQSPTPDFEPGSPAKPDARHFLMQASNLYLKCVDAANYIRGQREISDEHFQAAVATFFIAAQKEGFVSEMPDHPMESTKAKAPEPEPEPQETEMSFPDDEEVPF